MTNFEYGQPVLGRATEKWLVFECNDMALALSEGISLLLGLKWRRI